MKYGYWVVCLQIGLQIIRTNSDFQAEHDDQPVVLGVPYFWANPDPYIA